MNLNDKELYYNGYKNSKLQNLRILTPFGLYTPDFLLIKRQNNQIGKIMLIETKGHPYETPNKEKFVKTEFLKENSKFSYIKIGDVEDEVEYNKMIKCLEDFSK